MRPSNKHAYTLAELLIVISIILLVGAILFPVIRSAKYAATRTQCASNLRQIYMAIRMYEEEYHAPPILMTQFVRARPEVSSVLLCPADPSKGTEVPGARGPRYGAGTQYPPTSYEFWYFAEMLLRGAVSNPSSSEKAIVICAWHKKPNDDKKAQGVFGDGHVGWANIFGRPDWLTQETRLASEQARDSRPWQITKGTSEDYDD